MSIRLAINGYGRIGRCIHRQLLNDPEVEIVAINSRGNASSHAHLLKYDSIYGQCPANILAADEKTLVVNNKKIEVWQIADPSEAPWQKLKLT